MDAGEGAFVWGCIGYDVHVEGDAEVGYVVFLIGSDYEYEFRADHFQCVGDSCENELSSDVDEQFRLCSAKPARVTSTEDDAGDVVACDVFFRGAGHGNK